MVFSRVNFTFTCPWVRRRRLLSNAVVMIVLLLVWPLLQLCVEYKKRTTAGSKSGTNKDYNTHTRVFLIIKPSTCTYFTGWRSG